MTIIVIAKDKNFGIVLGEVKRQDKENNLTIGCLRKENVDIILSKGIDNEISELMNTTPTFLIDKYDNLYEYDETSGNFVKPYEGSLSDSITMAVYNPNRPADFEFLENQMKAIKGMTDNKLIHRHIDSTLASLEK